MFLTPIETLEAQLKEISKLHDGFELGEWLAKETNKILPNGTQDAKIELAKFLRKTRRKEIEDTASEYIKAIRKLKQ